jgi:purine-cytosine permease-like protein
MYLLGLTATLVTGSSDPGVLILQTMGKIGLALPALLLVVFSTITSDFPDVYSATCSMMNISRKIKPNAMMWMVGILCILLALVFPMDQYENFLLFIGAMFIPLFGVVLTDYFIIRKRKLKVGEIYKTGGEYWYSKGFNIAALAAWAIGFVTFEIIAIMKYAIGGSIPSMIAAGLFYFFITRSKSTSA